jgi:hypothetical protein
MSTGLLHHLFRDAMSVSARGLVAAGVIVVSLLPVADAWALQQEQAEGAPGPELMLPAGPRAGEELTVYHAVFGPGDAVWEKFGHNAIWIHDSTTGSTISYNYGMFAFDQVGFVPRLMRGEMLYSMWVRDADQELAAYASQNRSVTVQRLELMPQQRHALREFLEWNWLPQNREYLYDYFRDNCATRIRDALDRALGGAIASALTGVPTGTTYRWHSLRLTGASLPTYTGLVLGLGPPTDRPIDAWEESFIPMQLMQHLRAVQVANATGSRPLVSEERVLFEAARPAEPQAPPARVAGFLLAGLLLGGGLSGLGRLARRSRRGAFGLAVALSGWGLATGFFGLILALLWAATSHVYSYGNLNLLQVNPLGLLLAVAGPLAVLQRSTGHWHATSRLAWPAAVALAGLSATGLLLHLVPAVDQVNGPLIALLLPVHLGAVLALHQVLGPLMSSPKDSGPAIRLARAA